MTRMSRRRGGGGAGDVDREHHAHLLVADDRAPAREIAADHSDLDACGLSGREPAAVGTGVEDEVVDVLVVGVGQHDHESVAGRNRDGGRGEPHVARLDRDGRGLAGGGDTGRGRDGCPCPDGGRVDGDARGHRHRHGGEPGRGEAGHLAGRTGLGHLGAVPPRRGRVRLRVA